MNSSGIDTSVVITTCSRAASLAALLQSLLPQLEAAPFTVELVVVNDGSTDNTAEVLQQFSLQTRVPLRVVAGSSSGVAAARNVGLQAAYGRWIASCDDDQIALPGWLTCLRQAADDTGADVVGGSLTLHLPPPFEIADYGPRAQRLLGHVTPVGGVRAYPPGHAPATCNVLMRKDAMRRLGGYDVRFTEGGEDVDLFVRAAQAGSRVVYQPAACMLHMLTPRRLTTDGLRWTAQRVGAGDARMRKHTGGAGRLLRSLLVRQAVLLVRDLPQLALATLRRDVRNAQDVRCSIWYTLGLFRATPAVLRMRSAGRSAFLRSMDFRSRNGERSD